MQIPSQYPVQCVTNTIWSNQNTSTILILLLFFQYSCNRLRHNHLTWMIIPPRGILFCVHSPMGDKPSLATHPIRECNLPFINVILAPRLLRMFIQRRKPNFVRPHRPKSLSAPPHSEYRTSSWQLWTSFFQVGFVRLLSGKVDKYL
mgnify:CR=1 FL=1